MSHLDYSVIDKETIYTFDDAQLIHYHTNVPCTENYIFDKHLVTMMLSGVKHIVWDKNQHLRFQPNSIFIPPKDIDVTIDIYKASIKSPVDCVVLDISNDFVYNLYIELKDQWSLEWENIGVSGVIDRFYHFTSSKELCQSFEKFYDVQLHNKDQNSFLVNLGLKEISYLLLQSSACQALLDQSSPEKNNAFFETIYYIKNNFNTSIKVEYLAQIAHMSTSVFYKKFKENLGCSPTEYIILERIKYAKKLIKESDLTILEIAYNSGFNSPEYFHRKFKSLEKFTPSEFRTLHQKHTE